MEQIIPFAFSLSVRNWSPDFIRFSMFQISRISKATLDTTVNIQSRERGVLTDFVRPLFDLNPQIDVQSASKLGLNGRTSFLSPLLPNTTERCFTIQTA